MNYWGPAGVISAAVLSAAALLWKIRRDEIADLKEAITESVSGFVATLESQIKSLHQEIERLRQWRHDFGQKEMVYDDHGRRLESLETRVTDLERKG